MRQGKWKFLCDYDGSKPQLYDVISNRAEAENLADEHPEVVKQMREAVLKWNQSMPQDNGPALGAEKPRGKKGGEAR
jgi:uncharacterized sulfatase